MTKRLGSLEQLLMFATAGLADEAHGLAIRDSVEAASGRRVSPGAIYTTMDRLEQAGLVASRIEDERPIGGGRRRKFYRLEPEGARALADSYRSIETLAEGVLPLLQRIADGREPGCRG
ncbi:MAG: PadR family transcriptional regulator [Gemmatimonadota bacterium]|nr:PadR family transcriptional regulator [Gemmatimonadota bacterium]